MASILKMGAARLTANKRGSFAAFSTALAVFRALRKLSGDAPKTLFSHELRPGDVLVVSEPVPETKKSRRRPRRRSKR